MDGVSDCVHIVLSVSCCSNTYVLAYQAHWVEADSLKVLLEASDSACFGGLGMADYLTLVKFGFPPSRLCRDALLEYYRITIRVSQCPEN